VCVCLSVTTKSAAYLTSALKTKSYRVIYGVFKVFVVWLLLKRFVQEFWRHLLATAAFLASWRAFDEQWRQQ
jgi:hypothetical protein